MRCNRPIGNSAFGLCKPHYDELSEHAPIRNVLQCRRPYPQSWLLLWGVIQQASRDKVCFNVLQYCICGLLDTHATAQHDHAFLKPLEHTICHLAACTQCRASTTNLHIAKSTEPCLLSGGVAPCLLTLLLPHICVAAHVPECSKTGSIQQLHYNCVNCFNRKEQLALMA